jgi:twitching motility protein PilU
MDISPFLKLMVEKNASDLFFSVGAPPNIKIHGVTSALGKEPVKPNQMAEMVLSVTSDAQKIEFEEQMELNMAYSVTGVGRFRINIFRQRSELAMVVRYIQGEIPSLDALGLPPIIQSLMLESQGLILVVGASGSGKSTAMAAMIHYRNEQRKGHILTIEDPIEFLHKHQQSIVDQREIGIDTLSYANALKNARSEAIDVLMVGDIRDRNTLSEVLNYAETGHLCVSALHADTVAQAIERMIYFVPEDSKQQLLADLALNLRAIVALRLIPGLSQQRVPLIELLTNSPAIAELISKGKIKEIQEVMEKNSSEEWHTYDHSLFFLYQKNSISREQALHYAASKNDMAERIQQYEMQRKSQKSIKK